MSLSAFVLLVILNIALTELHAQAPAARASSNSSPFQFKAIDEKSLGLWEGDRPVLVYNYGSISNAAAPRAQSHSAYIHPIYGLDGEVLTDDFPKDHVYHRGLYWAWSHIKIASREYDTWSLRGIRIDFVRWLARDTKPDVAVLGVENVWLADGHQVMREKLWIEAHPSSSQSRAFDVALTWTPIGQPITLSGAEGKSYGGFTLRFGPRSQTFITVPTGRVTEDLLMTKLPWADFSGNLTKNSSALSGAAIFVHPSHPDFPPTWMTRDYGMLAVGWPGVTPKTFPPDEPISVRYRVWVHRGAPDTGEIQKAYDAYRSTSPSSLK